LSSQHESYRWFEHQDRSAQPILLRKAWTAVRRAGSFVEKRLYAVGLRSTRGLTLPDFLGIGAQKSGTTWLYANLRQHPELFLPDLKEVHYFDWYFIAGLRQYAELFQPAGQRLKGEITPSYGVLPLRRIAFVRAIMPDVRLVLLLRNPIERAWSQAVMNLVKIAGKPAEQVTEDEFIAHLEHERVVQRGDYLTMLNNWQRFFPAEQLHVRFFEDIAERPQELLRAIFRHLGVSSDVDFSQFPYRQVVFKGVEVPMPDRVRRLLEDRYRADIEALYRRFGPPIAPWRCH
jgi:hypothetical protein